MAKQTSAIEQFDLIKGEFSPQEAEEILMTLVNDKISFHQRNQWGKKERSGIPDMGEKKRISELKETRDALQALLSSAKDQGCTLKIRSQIEITFASDA